MVNRGHKPAVGEPVLDRAVRVLDAFGSSGKVLPLAELARRSALPTSTALRLAQQMLALGLLERLDDGRFAVGIRMLELGSRARRGNGIRSIALPFLEELHRATGNYVLLGVRDGDEAVLIERLSSVGPSDSMYPVGRRLPLAATGLGLALLAHAPNASQEDYLATPRIIEPEGVPFDPERLRRHLHRVRVDGFATISRSVGPRWASVGCPIFGLDDEPLAAVSVVAPPQELLPRSVRTALIAIAGVISRHLGGSGSRPTENTHSRRPSSDLLQARCGPKDR